MNTMLRLAVVGLTGILTTQLFAVWSEWAFVGQRVARVEVVFDNEVGVGQNGFQSKEK